MVNEYGTEASGASASGTLDQARHVAEKARERALNEVDSRRGDIAGRLSDFAQKLDELGRGQQGIEQQIVSRAAGYVRQAADGLQGKDTQQLFSDFASQVKRRPGLFFAGAAALGFLGGRLARR